jgi:hypothetical protein
VSPVGPQSYVMVHMIREISGHEYRSTLQKQTADEHY